VRVYDPAQYRTVPTVSNAGELEPRVRAITCAAAVIKSRRASTSRSPSITSTSCPSGPPPGRGRSAPFTNTHHQTQQDGCRLDTVPTHGPVQASQCARRRPAALSHLLLPFTSRIRSPRDHPRRRGGRTMFAPLRRGWNVISIWSEHVASNEEGRATTTDEKGVNRRHGRQVPEERQREEASQIVEGETRRQTGEA